MGKHTMKDLYELQALPLYLKVRLTKQRIRARLRRRMLARLLRWFMDFWNW